MVERSFRRLHDGGIAALGHNASGVIVRPPGQAGAASVDEGIGADQETETFGSGDSAEIPKPKRVCTSADRNSESGHNNFLWASL